MLNIATAVIAGIIVMLVSAGVGFYLSRYKSGVTEMLGMMIGMTQGMMTGIAVGYFVGAASDMFVSNLVGVIIGCVFGIVFGYVGGLMGILNGAMGGLMGGMMGAMLGVMLQYMYDGWAITITNVLIGVIYLASMLGLVRLVQKGVSIPLEIDLVCNMEVDPKKAHRHTLGNQTYYFCGATCKKQFIKKPEAYIKK